MSDDEEFGSEINGHGREKNMDHDTNDFGSSLSPTRKTEQDKSGKYENIGADSSDSLLKECDEEESSQLKDEHTADIENESITSDSDFDNENTKDDNEKQLHIEEETVPMDIETEQKAFNQLELDLMAELQKKVKVTEQKESDDEMDHGNSDLDQSLEYTGEKFEDKSGSEERKLITEDNTDGGEEMDTVGDLETVTNKLEDKKDKEDIEASGDDYDFSAIEPTSSTLNVEASKQRAQLRQKGSLAGRRKPTRASLRATANAAPQVIETVAANDRNHEKLVNGDNERTDKDGAAEKHEADMCDIKQDTNTSQATVSQGPVLRTGKTIQGVKTAIVLPGIAEMNSGKAKLRSSKPPVPLPKERKTSTGEGEEGPAAPWLMEAKLRRQSKPPPKGEVEKLQQEAEPERPAWMKDAELKRKRASSILTVRDQQKDQKDRENEEEQERPVAPWMREAQLRKINRPGPITMTQTHKEIHNNNDNNNILEHENPFIEQVAQQQQVDSIKNGSINGSEAKDISDSGISKFSTITPQPNKSKDTIIDSSKTIITSSTSSFSSSKEDFLSPRSGKSNKEVLQPIRKPESSLSSSSGVLQPIKKSDTSSVSSIHSLEQDENKPPHFSPGSSAILRTKDVPPIKSNVLPPLKTPGKVPCTDLSNEDRVSPSPTSSVLMREKSATPNKPVMKRPITMGPVVDSPMKMFETPQWKKDLMDKKKKRESLNPVAQNTEDINDGTSESTIDSAIPPWKRELEQRKSKRTSLRAPMRDDQAEKTEEVPDWIKQVQRRRSRYEAVSSKNNENGDP